MNGSCEEMRNREIWYMITWTRMFIRIKHGLLHKDTHRDHGIDKFLCGGCYYKFEIGKGLVDIK